MLNRLLHIERDSVGPSVCVVTTVLLVAAALFALAEFGEYIAAQIASLF